MLIRRDFKLVGMLEADSLPVIYIRFAIGNDARDIAVACDHGGRSQEGSKSSDLGESHCSVICRE